MIGKPTIMILGLILVYLTNISSSARSQADYTPLLLSRDELKESVFFKSAQDFKNPGKIYVYNQYILIVDLFKGVHVIDNSTPESPFKTGFIHIPGCMDVAVRNDILYADNSVDLVAIDLSSYPEISVVSRIVDVFPEPTPPGSTSIPAEFSSRNRPKNTVIVGWK